MSKIAKLALLALVCSPLGWAQDSKLAPAGAPAQMIVTVGHHYGHVPPVLTKDDLTVTERYEPLAVTDLIPLRGERAGLELFLLVDHCSNCEAGSKFEELSQFIRSQPASTAIGIAYIMNGQLQVAVNPSTDRDRAVKALNTPEGSKPAGPFPALAQLIRTWPGHASGAYSRRAVLMISNGINPSAPDKLQDPSAEAALEAAQRAGVTLYVIYHPAADYLKTDSSKLYTGQVQLAHVADETGGEAYFLGFGPLPSLAPFLADMADHLTNQYLLEFLANPAEGEGSMHSVTVKSKLPDVEVMVPNRVFVRSAEGAPVEERP